MKCLALLPRVNNEFMKHRTKFQIEKGKVKNSKNDSEYYDHVQYRVVPRRDLGWSWANIYGSSVGWLENTRMSTQPICYLY